MVYREECGHNVVQVAGEEQHHDVPDDGLPHAPSVECGCGPARVLVDGVVVYEHVDGDADPADYQGLFT